MATNPSPDDLLAGGIPLGDEDEGDAETFLGVSKGYVAQRPTQPPGRGWPTVPAAMSAPESVAPRYREGEQYRPKGWPPETVSMIQAAMDRAGLYGKGDRYVLGDWQEKDSTVYTKLLKYANRYGYTDQEALEEMRTLTAEERASLGLGGAGRGGGGGDGAAGSPLVVSLSHPDDIRSLADNTARKTLGRKLTAEQMTNFLSAYQQMERGAQTAEYNAGNAGGTVTQAPSPEVFAEGQVAAMDPLGAEANKEVDVFKIISGALGGMSSREG